VPSQDPLNRRFGGLRWWGTYGHRKDERGDFARDMLGMRGASLRLAVNVRKGVIMPEPDSGPSAKDNSRLSGGAIASLVGVALLLIFIIQNTERIRFHFLAWHFTWPLWVYTLVTAVVGALVWFGLGVMRRHRRRKERREYRRG
jgi:uncharacterized integral membrane protein